MANEGDLSISPIAGGARYLLSPAWHTTHTVKTKQEVLASEFFLSKKSVIKSNDYLLITVEKGAANESTFIGRLDENYTLRDIESPSGSSIGPVSVGEGGEYPTFEDAIAAGKYNWELIADYTLSQPLQLPSPQSGVRICSLHILNNVQLVALFPILTGTCFFEINMENPEGKPIVYKAPASGQYFIMYNENNDDATSFVRANNFNFDNQSESDDPVPVPYENTGPFGSIPVISNGKIICNGGAADNSGLTLDLNSSVNDLLVGSKQTSPVRMLSINCTANNVEVSGVANPSSTSNMVEVGQYSKIQKIRPLGAGGFSLNLAGRIESIMNPAGFTIVPKIMQNDAYLGNGNLWQQSINDVITLDTGVGRCVFENISGIFGAILGSAANEGEYVSFIGCTFTDNGFPTSLRYAANNLLLENCKFQTLHIGDSTYTFQPSGIRIIGCTATSYNQEPAMTIYKYGNDTTIGN